MQNDFNFLTKVTREDKVPVPFQKLLQDTCTCQIRHCTPMTPPIIFPGAAKELLAAKFVLIHGIVERLA